jgi:hypothetical protein
MITKCARQIFSAYRKDEYPDPQGFVLQLGTVLEGYSDATIQHVCSPLTGIQRHRGVPPNIKDVVDACDAEENRQRTIREASAFRRTAVSTPRPRPANWANVLVRIDHQRYEEMVERAKNGDAREWCWDEQGRGIKVVLAWLDQHKPQRELRRFTGEELEQTQAGTTDS